MMTLPNLQTTILETNATWAATARPIVRSYIAMADVGFYSSEWLAADDAERAARKAGDKNKEWAAKSRKSVYNDAKRICEKAEARLLELVDSIRQNAIDDALLNVDYDASDEYIDAQENWNDEFERGIASVEGLVKVVGDEM